jgi:hypothetical protein
MAEGKILVATTSATFDHEGRRIWLRQGRTTAREGHPILKGRENLFKPLEVDFEVTEKPAAKPQARVGGQQAGKPPTTARTAPGQKD